MKVARAFGIEVHLGYSWFLIFVFATIVMAMQFDNNFPDWPPAYQFFWGLMTSLLFFLSILGHEVAHSLIAGYHKIRVHSITLHVFGGYARLSRPARSPFEELTIAIAGPLASLFFGGGFALIWYFVDQSLPALALLTGRLAWINLVLAIFNILPGFPLDGGLVLRAALWSSLRDYILATRIASYVGQFLALAFMLGGLYLFISFGLTGLWFLMIGYNFFTASRAHLQEAALKDDFRGFKVGDFALQQLPQVNSRLSVKEFLDANVFGNQQSCYLVVEDNLATGVLSIAQTTEIATEQSEQIAVNQVMTPLHQFEAITPETNVVNALELMDCTEATQLPVVIDRQLQGFITREPLMEFIRRRYQYSS